MTGSDFESNEFSCCHVLFWTAAVFAFFGEVGFSNSSSSSALLFDPAKAVFLDGYFGGIRSLVLLMVFWAKHALVLWVFRPYLLQSQSFSLCLANSSAGTSFIPSANDGHRISWSGYLSLGTCPPLPPVISGALSFPWVFAPFLVGLDFSVS